MGRRPPGERLDVSGRDLDRGAKRRHPAVRFGSEEFRVGSVSAKLPQKGVLAPTVACDQDSHVPESTQVPGKKKG